MALAHADAISVVMGGTIKNVPGLVGKASIDSIAGISSSLSHSTLLNLIR